MKSSDTATPGTVTTAVDENTCSVHAGSPNRRNVTDPVGRNAPTRVATSRTGMPSVPPGDGAASMAAIRLAMTMVKVWQAGGATRLLPQTVVGPNVPAAMGTPVRNPSAESTTPGGRPPFVTEKTGSGVVRAVNWWR